MISDKKNLRHVAWYLRNCAFFGFFVEKIKPASAISDLAVTYLVHFLFNLLCLHRIIV